ncbi:MAG TPA: T9SS type A sorting domain-containing protein [Phnomibacter sp.]|nr:T9SS type A sorting domain-containing protein [Phnomibacter sp.]
MRKLYTIIFFSFCSLLVVAQTRSASQLQAVQHKGGKVPEIVSNTCDTIGFPVPDNYSVLFYTLGNNNGYLTGTNAFGDIAKSNYWDASANAGTYLSKLLFGIGYCNGPNLAKPISIVVYDGTSGMPGAVLGTINSTMADMKSVVDGGGFAILPFSPAIVLPASKKVFISFEFGGLFWDAGTNPATKDSFAILSTAANEPAVNNTWERFSDNTWVPMNNATISWGINLQLHVYPLVSNNQACALPVSFGKLTGRLSNKTSVLSWNTYAEIDNRGFEIERSIDGLKYATIGKVATKAMNGNHSGGLSYAFTDESPMQGQNLYRIKQIDKSGAFAYSNTISVFTPNQSSRHILSYYPNPTSGNLVIEFTQSMSGKANIQIADASGKIALQTKTSITNSRNTVVNVTSLKPGIYLLKLTEDNGTVSTIKFVKQ